MNKVIPTNSPVCVTGGSGYIASWIIQYLLAAGHTVHATVRDPSKAKSVAHLEAIAARESGTLKLFKADLLDIGSFDAAMAGCAVVIHTASPFVLEGYTDAHEALVRPAVEGTRNVLYAVNRTPCVQRVVLTSSVASVFGDNIDVRQVEGGVLTEAQWNTTSSVDHNPYQYSKVAAEREAWDMQAVQNRWDLVTINPGMVYGPSLTTGSQSASIDTLISMGDGRLRSGVPDLKYGVVDVRDVAKAHILASFKPDAEGRHLLVSKTISMIEIAKILRAHFGKAYPFPKSVVPKALVWAFGPMMGPVTRTFISKNVGHPLAFNNQRSIALGVEYLPVEQTFIEHFQQVLDDGQVKRRA